LAVAYLAEHILTGMGDRFQPRQTEEAAGAFDSMDQTKDVTQQFHIIRVLLELDQLDIQNRKILESFSQEFAEEIIHRKGPINRLSSTGRLLYRTTGKFG